MGVKATFPWSRLTLSYGKDGSLHLEKLLSSCHVLSNEDWGQVENKFEC